MFSEDFWRSVGLLVVGGAIGGLLYWTSAYLSNIVRSSPDSSGSQWSAKWQFCLANVFTGVGGAWAVLLAMLWANRAPLGGDTKELLELIGTSIVAGYAGNRVLPAVADRLLRELIEKASKTTVAAAVTATNQADLAKRSRLIAEVLAYLDAKSNQTVHQTDDYIAQLQKTLQADPIFRPAAIQLSRTLAECKHDLPGAIQVLATFVSSKIAAGGADDSDVADAYWNLANYYEQGFQDGGKADPSLRQKAIEALQNSLTIIPSYAVNLKADQDFQDLLNDPASRSLHLG